MLIIITTYNSQGQTVLKHQTSLLRNLSIWPEVMEIKHAVMATNNNNVRTLFTVIFGPSEERCVFNLSKFASFLAISVLWIGLDVVHTQ